MYNMDREGYIEMKRQITLAKTYASLPDDFKEKYE